MSVVLYAQPPGPPADLLARARDHFFGLVRRLPDYTCLQTVDRKYFKRTKLRSPLPSCDQLIGEEAQKSYTLKLEATDRLRLDVKVSDGVEIGSWAGASHFDSRSIFDLIGGGPFGTGPFGTLLWDIFASATDFGYAGEERTGGSSLFEYRERMVRRALLLDSLQTEGRSRPFFAEREISDSSSGLRVSRGHFHVWLPPALQQFNVGSFVFRTSKSRHVVPAGYESNWTTVLPPPQPASR